MRYAIPVLTLLVKMIVVLMQDRICYIVNEEGGGDVLGRKECAGVLSPLPVVVLRAEVEMHDWI
jgi:hypothetical protein